MQVYFWTLYVVADVCDFLLAGPRLGGRGFIISSEIGKCGSAPCFSWKSTQICRLFPQTLKKLTGILKRTGLNLQITVESFAS